LICASKSILPKHGVKIVCLPLDKQGSADYYIVNYIVLVKKRPKKGTTSSNNASITNTLLSSKYVLFLIHATKGWCKHFMSITQ
jgi:hypothetical protein